MGCCSSEFEKQLQKSYQECLKMFMAQPNLETNKQKELFFKLVYTSLEKKYLNSLQIYYNDMNNLLRFKNERGVNFVEHFNEYSKNITQYFEAQSTYMKYVQEKKAKVNEHFEQLQKTFIKLKPAMNFQKDNQKYHNQIDSKRETTNQKQTIPKRYTFIEHNQNKIYEVDRNKSESGNFKDIELHSIQYSLNSSMVIPSKFSTGNSSKNSNNSQTVKKKDPIQHLQFLQKQVYQSSQKIQSLTERLQIYETEQKKLRKQLQEQEKGYELQISSIKQNYQQQIRKIKDSTTKRYSSHVGTETLKKDLKISKSFSQIISSKKQKVQQKIKSFILVTNDTQSNKSEQNYSILFNLFPNSKILPSHQQFQSAIGIRTIISEMFSDKIRKAELIYSYDPITPIHYDKYIDDKQQILLLAKLKNGIIIGAYAGNFEQNYELSQSFLFSISPNREPMKLTSQTRVKRINMESTNLNFGNGDLKIKAKTLNLTCNVGSFQSIYTWGKRSIPIDKFLGGTQRNVCMQTYQIYQIEFKGSFMEIF